MCLRIKLGVDEQLTQVATAPESYAHQGKYCNVKGVSEVELTMESFDVIDGDWVSLGLVGQRW